MGIGRAESKLYHFIIFYLILFYLPVLNWKQPPFKQTTFTFIPLGYYLFRFSTLLGVWRRSCGSCLNQLVKYRCFDTARLQLAEQLSL